MNIEHIDCTSAIVATTEEMKEVCNKAVMIAANNQKIIFATRESLGAAETCND